MKRSFWNRIAPTWLTALLLGQTALLLTQVGGTLELFRGRVYNIELSPLAVAVSSALNFARSGAGGILFALLMLALFVGIVLADGARGKLESRFRCFSPRVSGQPLRPISNSFARLKARESAAWARK
jgi:hypothetical protein